MTPITKRIAALEAATPPTVDNGRMERAFASIDRLQAIGVEQGWFQPGEPQARPCFVGRLTPGQQDEALRRLRDRWSLPQQWEAR